MPVSLRKFKDDGPERQEVALCTMPPGVRFCLRTPAVWGYPETRVYGELIYVNASRCRVLLSGGQHQVVFGENTEDGYKRVRVFEAQGAAEVSWPRDITVEPIDWEGYSAAQQTRDSDPAERSSNMANEEEARVVQATGLQSRYDFYLKHIKKALDAKDDARVTLMQSKITALRNEAETKGVKLVDLDSVQEEGVSEGKALPKSSSAKAKAQADPNTPVAAKPLTGAALIAQQKKAAKLAALDPEAAKAMANLDKTKQKKDPNAQPKAKVARSSHDCLCGCGSETLSLYAPGHDARVKGLILKCERGIIEPKELPETIQPFVRFKGKWKTDGYVLTAAPVKIPGRPEVANTSLEALEAMNV